MRYISIALFILIVLSTHIAAQDSNNTCTPVNISQNDTGFDLNATVSNGYAIWVGFDGNSTGAYLYNTESGEKFRIPQDNINEPSTEGRYVVYTVWGDEDSDVYLYDMETETATNISQNTGITEMSVHINGNYVVWSSNASNDGTDAEINLYDIEKQTVTNISQNPDYNDINPQVSDKYVVWQSHPNEAVNGDVYVYAIDMGIALNISNTPDVDDQNPQINGETIWWHGAGTSGDVFMFDNISGTVTNITNNNQSVDRVPVADGNYAVWESAINGLNQVALYDYVTGEITLISEANSNNSWPQISGNFVVWQTNLGNFNWEIIAYDIETGIRTNISQNTDIDDNSPHVEGQYVVWGGRNLETNSSEIYLYDLACGE